MRWADPDEEIRKKAMQIAEKSIELAVDLGVRTVMIPGYDIYFGESTIETKKYFLENVKKDCRNRRTRGNSGRI